jgi:hypothetical protein
MTKKTALGKQKNAPKGKPKRKNPNAALAMKAMWASPEGRARMDARDASVAEQRKADPQKFSRFNIPNGMTKATVAPLVAKANRQADRFIQKMKDEGVLPEVLVPDSDEARSEAALKEACVIALSPGEKQAKMAAIRTVLEWTRAKPASKSSININTSEDWLAEIAAADAAADAADKRS